MSMSRGTLKRLLFFGGVAAIAGVVSCAPPVPSVSYTGTTFTRRIQPGALKIHRASLPDELYQDIGNVKIACKGDPQESTGALGGFSGGRGGCSFSAALELARQQASASGAHGLHSISTTPAANGNIVSLNATAFRYTSQENEPRLGGGVPPLPPMRQLPVVAPAPAPEPATETASGDESQAAPPSEDAPYVPKRPLPAAAAPTRLASPSRPATTVYPQLRTMTPFARNNTPSPSASPSASPSPSARPVPVLVPSTARPAPMVTIPEAPATTSAPVAEKPPLVIVPPPAIPLIPPPPPGSTSAATLLPAEERLRRLKELRDKNMIPASIYERRKKEILQGN